VKSSTDLSAAVDVYAEWIDACDAVAKDAADATGKTAATSYREIDVSSRGVNANGPAARQGADDFLDDDDAEGEADYGDE